MWTLQGILHTDCLEKGIHLIHLWILLPVKYISSLQTALFKQHYLNSIIRQNPYIQLIHITLTVH